eukprot:403368235
MTEITIKNQGRSKTTLKSLFNEQKSPNIHTSDSKQQNGNKYQEQKNQNDESFTSGKSYTYTTQEEQIKNIQRRKRLLPIKSEQLIQMEDVKFLNDQIQEMALPYSPSMGAQQNQHSQKVISQNPSQPQLLVITEESLDDWLAQSINLDLKNMPSLRKLNIPQQTKDILQKYEPKKKTQYSQIPSAVKNYIDNKMYLNSELSNQNDNNNLISQRDRNTSNQTSHKNLEKYQIMINTPSGVSSGMQSVNNYKVNMFGSAKQAQNYQYQGLSSNRTQASTAAIYENVQSSQLSARWTNPSAITPRDNLFSPQYLQQFEVKSVVDKIEELKQSQYKLNKKQTQTFQRKVNTENLLIRSKSNYQDQQSPLPQSALKSNNMSPLLPINRERQTLKISQLNLSKLGRNNLMGNSYTYDQNELSFRKLKAFEHKVQYAAQLNGSQGNVSNLDCSQRNERFLEKLKYDYYKVPYGSQRVEKSNIIVDKNSFMSTSTIQGNNENVKKSLMLKYYSNKPNQYAIQLDKIVQMQQQTAAQKIIGMKEMFSYQSFINSRQDQLNKSQTKENNTQNQYSTKSQKELPRINQAINIIAQSPEKALQLKKQLLNNSELKVDQSPYQTPQRKLTRESSNKLSNLVKRDSSMSIRQLINQNSAQMNRSQKSLPPAQEQPHSVFRDSNFWLHKAFYYQKDKKINACIDSLRKAIALDFTNLQAHLNLASMLYKKEQYSESIQAYKNIINQHEVLNDSESYESALYGLILCFIQIKDYEQAYAQLEILISANDKFQDQNYLNSNKPQYVFIKAVLHRKLCQYEESEIEYKRILKIQEAPQQLENAQNTENEKDLYNILNKKCLDFLQNVKIPSKNTISSGQQIVKYYSPNDGWMIDQFKFIAQQLQKLSFFCRFNAEQLQHFLKYFQVEIYSKDQVVFIEDNFVRIVLDGQLKMLSHQKNVCDPEVISYLHPGDIINYSKIDNGQSQYFQNWIVSSENYETSSSIVCSQEFFNFIWEQQNTNNNMMIFQTMKNHPILQGVTLQTLYLLAFELIQIREYDENQLILKQALKSKLKNFHQYFYGNRLSSLSINKQQQEQKQLKINQSRLSPIQHKQQDSQQISKGLFNTQSHSSILTQKYSVKDINQYPITQVNQESRIKLNALKKTDHLIDLIQNQNPIEKELLQQNDPNKETLRNQGQNTKLQLDTNNEVYNEKLQSKTEKQKLEYLLDNVFKKNLDILQEYCQTFNVNTTRDDSLDGLYIIDEGQCFVKSNYDKNHDKDQLQKAKCMCQHYRKHVKPNNLDEQVFPNKVKIEDGQLHQRNCCAMNNKQDSKILRKGDYFGLSDFFRIKTLNYYGDIVVSPGSKVSCLYLKKQYLDKRIPFYDLEQIKKNCMEKGNMQEVSLIGYQGKFAKLAEEFINNQDS